MSILEQIAVANGGDVPKDVLAQAKLFYQGEVEYVDLWVGRLLDSVATLRDLDEVLVIFTADHGECFENGVYFEHADCLFQGAIRVPMIVRLPKVFERGGRVATQVSLIDIAPTILLALDAEIPSGYSGRPLQELIDAEDRYVLVQHPFYGPAEMTWRRERQEVIRSVGGEPTTPLLIDAEKVGIVSSSWKYLTTEGAEELYSLDPRTNETKNLASREEELRARLRAVLEAELKAHPLNLIDSQEINEELIETLRALGYLPRAD